MWDLPELKANGIKLLTIKKSNWNIFVCFRLSDSLWFIKNQIVQKIEITFPSSISFTPIYWNIKVCLEVQLEELMPKA